eukprot:TRINITY_DN15769_c3_g1_i1.p1 TRINITY_DN15769_c3_g1~~TRINITY_DN15769_c3_g1_i1.p1  ORF type:complete len:367 (+),score=47.12 TRINITY_DN15769_c3_g1_i1:111-1103(+)
MQYQYGGSPRGYDAYCQYRREQGSPIRGASPGRTHYQPTYSSPVYSSSPSHNSSPYRRDQGSPLRTPPSHESSPYRSQRMHPSLSTYNVTSPPQLQTSYNGIYSSPSSNGSRRTLSEHRLLGHSLSQPCRSVEILVNYKRLSGIQIQHLDLLNGEHKKPEMLRINPAGQVPALIMAGQSPPLTESLAILKFLDAERNTGLVPTDPKEAARCDEYCGYHLSGVRQISTGTFVKFIFGKTDELEASKEGLNKILKSLDDRLKKFPYIAGYQMTIGDFLVVPEVDQLLYMPGDLLSSSKFPNLVAYIYRMHQIPAFKKSFEGGRAFLQSIGKI